MEREGFELRR